MAQRGRPTNQQRELNAEQAAHAEQVAALQKQVLAAQRMLRLRAARDSLLDFTTMSMPHPEDPDDAARSRYDPQLHHRIIAEALQEVEKGSILRLIITMPPRAGKSELVSKRFPAWFTGRDPYRHTIVAGYSDTFVEEFGREVREIMTSPFYQQVFPGTRLRRGSKAADRLQTSEGGILTFAGVGGGLTGKGADCLPAGTMILTPNGEVAIENLLIESLSGKVVGYDDQHRQIVQRRIKAVAARKAKGLYRVTTASGRVVEATAEHPFFTGGGYTKAAELAAGDRLLLALPRGIREAGVRSEQAHAPRASGVLLQQGLCVQSLQRKAGFFEAIVSGVLGPVAAIKKVVFRRVQGGSLRTPLQAEANQVVSAMQRFIRAAALPARLLQQGLRQCCAWGSNVGGCQPWVAAWGGRDALQAACDGGLQVGAPENHSAGWRRVPSLRQHGESSRPSSGHERIEQSVGQPGHSVRELSHEMARRGTFDLAEDSVALVEYVCGDTTVYNLQVEGTENFFANGVLTHNCAIIDDPIKNSEDANSPALREKQWEWFTRVLMTRLMTAAGRVIICMTRWHEDDLVGRLTDPKNEHYNENVAKQFKILHIPALAEPGDVLRREVGESLWPDRFPSEFLLQMRELDPTGFNALYQGRPTPPDGDFFKREWIYKNRYQPAELPRNLRVYVASDHAVSTDQRRDATCMLAAGVDEQGVIWILPHAWWRRADTEVVVEGMLEMMRYHKPLIWWAEKGHISKSIGPFLRKRMQEENTYVSLEEVVPVKDKQTRAQAIQGRIAQGRVRFPLFAPWWAEAEAEILKFPGGTHDDFVDALAHLGMGLARQVRADKPAGAAVVQPRSGTFGWMKMAAKFHETQQRLTNRGGF